MRAFVPGSVTLSGDMGWGGGTPARYLIRSNTSSALVLWKQTPACFETPLPDG